MCCDRCGNELAYEEDGDDWVCPECDAARGLDGVSGCPTGDGARAFVGDGIRPARGRKARAA